MDKAGANFDKCLKSIEKKLNTVAVPLQMPIGEEKTFIGVVDLVNMNKLTWNNQQSLNENGRSFNINKLSKGDELYNKAIEKRVYLIDKLAQVNEEFAEILLDKYSLDYEAITDHLLLETYLRKSTLNCLITPVLCGSSFKNISVQPLMDAIIKYLPNPLDLSKNNYAKYYENGLSAICFKILHDHQKSRKRINSATSTISLTTSTTSLLNKNKNETESLEDVLTFVRVYSGELVAKSKLYNVNKQEKESCDKIYIPYANQLKQANRITSGNIGIVSGLSKVQKFKFN